MPARRKNRKKKAAASSPTSVKSPPLTSSSKKATPRRRKDLALLSTLPRRTSPRIAALNRRKMIENGLTPPPLQSEVAKHVVDMAPDLEGQDRPPVGSNGSNLMLTNVDPSTASASEPPPPPAPSPARHFSRRRTASAAPAPEISFEPIFDEEEEEEDAPLDEEDAPLFELASTNVKEAEDDIENHAVILHFGNCHELAAMGFNIGPDNVKSWIYNNVDGGRDVIGEVQFVRDLGQGFYGVFFEHAITCSSLLQKKSLQFGGSIQVTAFKWMPPLNDEGRHCVPRMIVLPGLPDLYQRMLDKVGAMFGTYVGSILDPAAENPRVAVMVPVDETVPKMVRLMYKGDKPLRQVVLEQLPIQPLQAVIMRGKRKLETISASPAKQQKRSKKV